MALLFSKVSLFNGESEAEFLAMGIPQDYEDLERYTAFAEYVGELSDECDIEVNVESYLYGDDETVKASIEEVAYLTMRMGMKADFLERSCKKTEESSFLLRYSPEELFGMEMKS